MNANIIDQCDTGDMKNGMKSVHKVRCIMKMFLIKPLITLSTLGYNMTLAFDSGEPPENIHRADIDEQLSSSPMVSRI